MFSGSGNIMTRNMENARVLHAFLAFVFTGRICPQFSQAAEPSGGVCGSKTLPTAKED